MSSVVRSTSTSVGSSGGTSRGVIRFDNRPSDRKYCDCCNQSIAHAEASKTVGDKHYHIHCRVSGPPVVINREYKLKRKFVAAPQKQAAP